MARWWSKRATDDEYVNDIRERVREIEKAWYVIIILTIMYWAAPLFMLYFAIRLHQSLIAFRAGGFPQLQFGMIIAYGISGGFAVGIALHQAVFWTLNVCENMRMLRLLLRYRDALDELQRRGIAIPELNDSFKVKASPPA